MTTGGMDTQRRIDVDTLRMKTEAMREGAQDAILARRTDVSWGQEAAVPGNRSIGN